MNVIGERGMSLLELLMALTIMGLIAGATVPLVSSSMNSYDKNDATSSLYQEGLIAMERMTSGVRSCTFLLIPNFPNNTRDILAFSGTYNDDGDNYFGDPLFPRIDEDPNDQMTYDNKSGIRSVDDNGDGSVDEGFKEDDDEDGVEDEDPLDGIDNDLDGNIDEDFKYDITDDGQPGIAGMDDDGDGSVDEGDEGDDDEDGDVDEDPLNPVIYQFISGSNTLREVVPHSGFTSVLSTHVTQFQVTSGVSNCVLITMTLTGDDGETLTFSEYVYPRNSFQKTGKRVR